MFMAPTAYAVCKSAIAGFTANAAVRRIRIQGFPDDEPVVRKPKTIES